MASQSITQYRIAVLEDMGEEAVAEAYWQHRTVKRMVAALFDPRKEGEEVTWAFFYEWIKRGGEERTAWWQSAKKIRGELDAEEAIDTVMDADTKNSHLARLRADTLRWRAERTNRNYSSKLDVNKTVTVDLGAGLLEAIRQNELAKPQTLAIAAEAIDEAPFWEVVEE